MEFEPKLHLPFLIGSYFLFQHIDLGLGYYLFFSFLYLYTTYITVKGEFLRYCDSKKGVRD